MRIAICFSGLVRSFDENYKSIKKRVIDRLPVKPDIFCYFGYDGNEDKAELLKRLGNHVEIKFEKDPDMKVRSYTNHICNSQWINYPNKSNAEDGVKKILLHWYFVKKCNELKCKYEKKNSFVYDWVILCRPDLLFTKGIEDLNKLDNSKLYVPKHDNHHGINDRFNFSNSRIMNIRMKLYDWFPRFHKNFEFYREKYIKSRKKDGKWSGETVLYSYIRDNKIDIERTEAVFCTNRGKGNIYKAHYESRTYDILNFYQKIIEEMLSFRKSIWRLSARLKKKSGIYRRLIRCIKK